MRWPGRKPSANLARKGRLRHPKPFQSIFFLSPFKGLHHHRNITRNSSRRTSEKNKKHHFTQQLHRAPPPITASNTIITISHIALPAAFVSRLSLQSIVLCSRVPRPVLKLLPCCSAFVPELLATNLQPYCSLRPLSLSCIFCRFDHLRPLTSNDNDVPHSLPSARILRTRDDDFEITLASAL